MVPAERVLVQGTVELVIRRGRGRNYEIRTVTREAEAYSVTGGVFLREGFEERYESASP